MVVEEKGSGLSIITVHAPHPPSPHPIFVPVSFSVYLRYSARLNSGSKESVEMLISLLLTKKSIVVFEEDASLSFFDIPLDDVMIFGASRVELYGLCLF